MQGDDQRHPERALGFSSQGARLHRTVRLGVPRLDDARSGC
jgi:hypothetical protein